MNVPQVFSSMLVFQLLCSPVPILSYFVANCTPMKYIESPLIT